MENDKECIHDINDVENLVVDKVTQSSGEAKIKARMETSANIRVSKSFILKRIPILMHLQSFK